MSSFVLKIIAAVSMFIDHTGLLLFPKYPIFRIIGRLAFPIYAYCIAEGFRYTHSRMRYFLRIFGLGLICQIVYTIADHELYLGVLITFSFSIIVMAAMECVKSAVRGEKSALAGMTERLTGHELSNQADRMLSTTVCCTIIILLFLLTTRVTVDYGFFGIMLPVCANLFEEKGQRLVMFSACLLALCIDVTPSFAVQYWSLLTIPLIAAYNGEPGKYRMKYFFYIFYPAHLVLLYGISMLR